MSTGQSSPEQIDFPLVHSGYVNSLSRYCGQSRPSLRIRLERVLILVAVTWLPLLVLSLMSGHTFAGKVDVPLLHDPALSGRLLFVLPVLELAEAMVAISLPIQIRHFTTSQIVPAHQRPQFETILNEVLKLRSSVFVELLLGVTALVSGVIFHRVVFQDMSPSWEHDATTTPAGWYYALVSLPILYFFVLRWLWIFGLWGWFLFRVSQLDLQLTPTHPDHAGGLGFLGWGLASFSGVVMAISAMFSSAVFYEIIHKNQSIETMKYHLMIFVIITLSLVHAPLLVFFWRMSRCRFLGLLEFSSLVLRYDRAFEEKWIEKRSGEPAENLLGTPDVQSLVDIARGYEHVTEMWLLPFDITGIMVLVAAALIPMLPLLGTALPLNAILTKLAELMI
ncbi:hypothetical protein [Schlesneria sp. DSM 10557]|uniref:hypothetical protein n=1 Tax=Schlesneria sp. DSM 10557 TaxID=3044399 RepID=UPI0035A10090